MDELKTLEDLQEELKESEFLQGIMGAFIKQNNLYAEFEDFLSMFYDKEPRYNNVLH